MSTLGGAPPRLVVKVGGGAIADLGVLETVAAELASLQSQGTPIVVVHGGGVQADRLGEALGLERRVVAGRRITDAPTLEVMKMAVAGQASVALCAALGAAGAHVLGVAGVSAGLVRATRRPPRVVAGGGAEPIDFGHVGDVVSVNTTTLRALLDAGCMPVVACLGADPSGAVFNINADIIATRVAADLGARLMLLTGAPGVLADPEQPSSRIPALSPAGFEAAVQAGSIRAGMLPKLEESFRVIRSGQVPAVHIVLAGAPGAMRRELAVPGSEGTVLRLGHSPMQVN